MNMLLLYKKFIVSLCGQKHPALTGFATKENCLFLPLPSSLNLPHGRPWVHRGALHDHTTNGGRC